MSMRCRRARGAARDTDFFCELNGCFGVLACSVRYMYPCPLHEINGASILLLHMVDARSGFRREPVAPSTDDHSGILFKRGHGIRSSRCASLFCVAHVCLT